MKRENNESNFKVFGLQPNDMIQKRDPIVAAAAAHFTS